MTNEEIEIIKIVFQSYLNIVRMLKKPNSEEVITEVRDKLIKTLEQQRWTPVSEGLPKEQRKIGNHVFSENVLGTDGYTIRRAYYNYTTKEWLDGNEEMVWTKITHWMPLLEEPPMAESEDKR